MLRRCIQLLSCNGMLGYTYAAKIHTNYARVLYCSYNKDLPNPALQTPLRKADSCGSNFLMDQISNSKTLDSILELFLNHQDVINAHHIVALLKSIHNLLKAQGLNPETLRENQTFHAVCSQLMTEIRTLEAQDVIVVYKVLTSFGIRNNSYVMKSVLVAISKNLNRMDLEQVATLNYIISKQKHNGMVDDLRLALPLILQVKIERQLASEDMSQVVDCLRLAYRSRLQPVTVQKIVSSILTKAKNLSPSNAATALSAMVHINTPVDDYNRLLDTSFEVVTEDIESLDQNQVLSILKLCREKGFYRKTFFSEAAKRVVSERWCQQSTHEVLKVFDAMKFHSPELKDHFNSASCLDFATRTAKAV